MRDGAQKQGESEEKYRFHKIPPGLAQIDSHRLVLTQTMISSATRSRELVRPGEICGRFWGNTGRFIRQTGLGLWTRIFHRGEGELALPLICNDLLATQTLMVSGKEKEIWDSSGKGP
jgi:hypothetical protein